MKIKEQLSEKHFEDMWGEDGPYSQAHLLIEERILDDSISRTFVYVQTLINPFTFRFVKKNVKSFSSDPMVLHILSMAEYKGTREGFVSIVHGEQLVDQGGRENAEKILIEARQAVIRMHQFVIDYFQSASCSLKRLRKSPVNLI